MEQLIRDLLETRIQWKTMECSCIQLFSKVFNGIQLYSILLKLLKNISINHP